MKNAKKLWILFLILFFLIGCLIFILNPTSKNQILKKSNSDYDSIISEEKISRKREDEERNKFIKEIAPISQEIQNNYHILASITIAQACLESDWGRSSLSSKYNNYFGIKGNNGPNTVTLETKEFVDGHWIKKKANFMVYKSMEDSMKDHAELLKNGTSWNENQYQEVIDAKDYQAASQALLRAGYATDPDYARKLIQIINQYNLNRFDTN